MKHCNAYKQDRDVPDVPPIQIRQYPNSSGQSDAGASTNTHKATGMEGKPQKALNMEILLWITLNDLTTQTWEDFYNHYYSSSHATDQEEANFLGQSRKFDAKVGFLMED